MKKTTLPKMDSINALAEFWDAHDLTDYEDEMEEVAEPVFVRDTPIKVHLESSEAEAVQKLAMAKGVSQGTLIRQWVLQKIAPRKGGERKKTRS